jgi:hypothetical protein
MGQRLNGDRDVMRDLRGGVRTPEGIAHAREALTESLRGFVEGRRELFAAVSSGDQPRCYREWIAQLPSLIGMLPPANGYLNLLRKHNRFVHNFDDQVVNHPFPRRWGRNSRLLASEIRFRSPASYPDHPMARTRP